MDQHPKGTDAIILTMMEKLPEGEIEKYVQQKLDGRSYSEIRSQLKESGLPDSGVTEAIRVIDEKVLEAETGRESRKQARRVYWAGLALAVAGLLISIAYNAGVFLTGWNRLIVYAPFFIGIVLMFYARRLQRRYKGRY